MGNPRGSNSEERAVLVGCDPPALISSEEEECRLQEGCGQDGPLRSIFLAEFHHVQGPVIRCEATTDGEPLMTKDFFDATSVFIIPKMKMTNRTLTFNVKGMKVLGFPVVISDKKYPRNQFMFNVGFVCYDWSRSIQYESGLKKLCKFFLTLEREEQSISKNENTPNILTMLQNTLRDLNLKGSAITSAGDYLLQLQVIGNPPDPPVVYDYSVPVLYDVWNDLKHENFDLTTNKIISHIDGVHTVRRIAQLAHVDTGLVKVCVQNLTFFELVRIVSIFRFSNCYCTTTKVRDILDKPSLQADMLELCALSEERPNIRAIYRFVTEMKHGKTIRALVFQYPNLGVDIMCLVQFLCIHGIIRRVHTYPFLEVQGQPHEIYNGCIPLDDFCTKLGMSPENAEEYLERSFNVQFLKK